MAIVGDIADVRGLRENTSDLFRLLVLEMAERLGTNPDWIVAVMSSETGGTFDPAIRNPQGGATGLIQFMPATAKRLGTTTGELAAMIAEEQLEYVERYFEPFGSSLRSPDDVYMAIFLPAHVGKPASNVIAVEGSDEPAWPNGPSSDLVYRQNAGLDADKDGTITNGDVGSRVRSILAAAQGRPRIEVSEGEGGGAARRGGVSGAWLFVGAAALAGALYLYRRER